MNILAFETSCDETSAAIVEDGTIVRSNIIATSKRAYENSGGVIPEDAARRQVESILPVLHQALDAATISPDDVTAIAVTRGPGLLGSLLVGTTTARLLSSLWQKPLIGIHHTFGHLSSTWLDIEDPPAFPIITLSASGGHTDLWYRSSHTIGSLVGRTRDDAAGEAFDKGASMLGLPYPGGPSIAREAEQGNPSAFPFPDPLHGDKTLNFSFSGLKTALKYTIRDLDQPMERCRRDLAASYQHALCMHLVHRILQALKQHPDVHELHIVGGVAANEHLRTLLRASCGTVALRTPGTIAYCTDNASMIAAAAYFLLQERPNEAQELFATQASLALETVLRPG